jgi:circadian clock protein KaiC
MDNDRASAEAPKVDTDESYASIGVAALDEILHGGLIRNRSYLVRGEPGAGKTTLALQYAICGALSGETTLYVTTCESADELRDTAESHGWSLHNIHIHYHDTHESNAGVASQSVFHSSDVQLPLAMQALLEVVEEVNPERLVVDSLSEIRLIANDRAAFRREVVALKSVLANRNCTTIFCDSNCATDDPIQSVVSGIVRLEFVVPMYGPARRRVHISKLRGQDFESGFHDFKIRTGGIEVYPRLVAAEHRKTLQHSVASTGLSSLDDMLDGGLDRGASILLMGPTGAGKSLVADKIVATAAERRERSVIYLFDESVSSSLTRTSKLGIPLEDHLQRGTLEVRPIDPAELTPGEFSCSVQAAVLNDGVRFVLIDSLAGYLYAMPNERFLILHLHELLTFLSQHDVTVVLVLCDHGSKVAAQNIQIDLSYIADTVLLFHHWMAAGSYRKALSVHKRRAGAHDSSVRELLIGPDTVEVGAPVNSVEISASSHKQLFTMPRA